MTRRTPAQYDWATCSFDDRILPAKPVRIHAPRRQPIKGVTIHHLASRGTGNGAAIDGAINTWKTREASAHYIVDGPLIAQCVWDSNEAWACADSKNSNGGNQTTLSIEHANSTAGPEWKVSSTTWKTGAKLVAALHVLYELGRPVKGVTKNHKKVSGTVFRHHDWASTECCGPYLDAIFDEYVAEAQHQYDLMVDATPTPTPKPPANVLPAGVLNLADWKLTLPTGSAGKPTEILQPKLATYEDANFYVDDPGDGVVFRAQAGGVTTSGSGYPRCELREMNGAKLAAWSSKSGTHTMKITQAITHLPKVKPHVVAGQVHDADDDVLMIRLEGKKLFVESPYAADQVLDADYVLGTKFTVQIHASAGTFVISYNGVNKAKVVRAGAGNYFKAGCYTQSNTSKGDAASAYGEVVIYDLIVSHTTSTTPTPTPNPEAPVKKTLSDPRIIESSGFTFSSIHDDQALTLNDENGPLFTVQPSTGNTIGTYKLPYKLIDPESVRAFGGFYYVLDGGNNDLKRTTMVLYRFPDMGAGNHTLTTAQVDRWVLEFPDKTKRDTESLLVDPSGRLSIMTKGSPNGREFAIPASLSKTSTTKLVAGAKVPELVSDAAYVRSGKFRVLVQKKRPGVVSIVDGAMKEVHVIKVEKLAKCESIDVSPDGETVTVGSEGKKSPIVTVELPAEYR